MFVCRGTRKARCNLYSFLGKVYYMHQFFRDRFKMNAAIIFLKSQELADLDEPCRRDVYP